MQMPSISPEDRARLAQAICSLADEYGENGFTSTMITERAGCNHRKTKDFMDQYGEDEQPQYWKKIGRKKTVTTSGRMIFENLAGNFVSNNLGNNGIPHLSSSDQESTSSNAISKEERLCAAVDILIERYADNWSGDCQLEYEWNSWPEWFILNRLPWLISPSFYWPNNRDGSLPPGGVHYGYYRSEDMDVTAVIDSAIDQVSE